jgi:hypothetical protein
MMIEDLSIYELSLLSCYYLGGSTKKIHYEAIVHQAFLWAPEKFSWKLPDFKHIPDKDKSRRELMNARKDKLVIGAKNDANVNKDGYELTDLGVAFCLKLAKYIPVNETTEKISNIGTKNKDNLDKIKLINNYLVRFEKINPKNANILNLFEILRVTSGNNSLLRDIYFKLRKIVVISIYERVGDEVDDCMNKILDLKNISSDYESSTGSTNTQELAKKFFLNLTSISGEMLSKTPEGKIFHWMSIFEYRADEKIKNILDLDKHSDQYKVHGAKWRIENHE